MSEFLDDSFEGQGYEPKPLMPIASKWGAIGGGLLILISVAVYALGETIPSSDTSTTIQVLLNTSLYGVIALMSQQELRTEQGGYIKYGRALGIGFVALLLLSFLSTIWNMVLTQVLDPSIAQARQEMVIQNMQEQGLPEAQVEEMIEAMAVMRNPFVMIFVSLLTGGILMVIVSAITAAFTKKTPPQGY